MKIDTEHGTNIDVYATRKSDAEIIHLTVELPRGGGAFVYLTRGEAMELAKALRWEVDFLEDADRCVPLRKHAE